MLPISKRGNLALAVDGLTTPPISAQVYGINITSSPGYSDLDVYLTSSPGYADEDWYVTSSAGYADMSICLSGDIEEWIEQANY